MNNIIFHSLTEAVGWTLLHFVWQAAAAVAILWILLKVFSQKSAQVRYLISCLVMFSLAILSTATLVTHYEVSEDHSQLISEPEIDENVVSKPTDLAINRLVVQPKETESEKTSSTDIPEPVIQEANVTVSFIELVNEYLKPWLSWIVGLWVVGVMLLSIRFLNSWRMARHMVHSGELLEDSIWEIRMESLKKQLKLSKPIQLLVSSATTVPVVIGWLKPVILLPGTVLTGMDASQLEAILAHELAHIRRHDYLVNILQNVMEILFFYHPGLKWISQQIRIERECCCDDIASQVSGGALDYARALTALVALRPELPANHVLAASGGSLLLRIKRLLKVDQAELTEATGSGALMTTLLAIIVMIPLLLGIISKNLDADIKPEDLIKKPLETKIENKVAKNDSKEKGFGQISGSIVLEDGTVAKTKGRFSSYSIISDNSTAYKSLDPKGNLFSSRVRTGEVWLIYLSKEYAPAWAGPFHLKKGEEINGVKLVLKKGFSAPLGIVNQKNESIPHAVIIKHPVIKTLSKPYRGGPTIEEKTNDKGEMLLKQIADTNYDFIVRAPGYEPLRSKDIKIKPDEPVVLKMTPAVPTTGTVYLHDGTPAKGAKLLLMIEDQTHGKYSHHSFDYGNGKLLSVTDEAGNFVLDQLPRNSTNVFLIETADQARYIVDEIIPGMTNKKITVPPRKDLKVKITGNIDLLRNFPKKPIVSIHQARPHENNFHSYYVNTGNSSVPVTITNEGAEVTYPGLISGKVKIIAGNNLREVDVNENGVTEVAINLLEKGKGRVSGSIILEDGTPSTVKGQLLYDIGNTGGTLSSPVDQFSGKFQAGEDMLWLKHFVKGYAPVISGPIEIKEGKETSGIKLILKKGISAHLKVLNDKDQPVSGAKIMKHPVFQNSQGKWGGGVNQEEFTDNKGELNLKNLAETPYDFTVTAPGYEPLRSKDLAIKRDEEIVLKMKPSEPTTGIIYHNNGSPASGAKIRMRHEFADGENSHSYGYGSNHVAAITDDNGNYVFDQLTKKSVYMLIVELDDGSRFILDDLVPGSKNRKLTAPPEKELRVRIFGDASKLPVWKGKRNIDVRQRYKYKPTKNRRFGDLIYDRFPLTLTDEGAEGIWRGLIPGKVEITVGKIKKEVAVNEEGVTEVVINLPEKKETISNSANNPKLNIKSKFNIQTSSFLQGTGSVSGKIVMEDGSPATATGKLYYSNSGFNHNHGKHTNKFSISNLQGDVELRYFTKKYEPLILEPFRVEKGEHINDITLVLKKGFTTSLQIRNQKNKPIPEAFFYMIEEDINILGTRHTFYMTKTDKNGEHLLEGLSKIPYNFQLRAPGYEYLRLKDIHIKQNEPLVLKMTPVEPTTGTIFNHDGTPAKNASINFHLDFYKGKLYGSDHAGITTDDKGYFSIDQLSRKSKYLILAETEDNAKLVINDLVAGSKSRKITVPRRKDLKVNITGDISILQKHEGKPYVVINQKSYFGPFVKYDQAVISEKRFLTPTDDGGVATYQGLVSGQVEVDTGIIVKKVNVVEKGMTEVTIDLPEMKVAEVTSQPDPEKKSEDKAKSETKKKKPKTETKNSKTNKSSSKNNSSMAYQGLTLPKGSGWVSGKIVMSDGSPATATGKLYYINSGFGFDRGLHTNQFSIKTHRGDVWLRYFVKGYAPVIAGPIRVENGQQVKNIKLVLTRGFSTQLQIRNQKNEPIPQARFYMVDGIYNMFGSRHTFYMTKTDENGKHLLEGLSKIPYEFNLNAPGYEILRLKAIHIKQNEPLVLKMTSAKPTTGTIFNHDGTPAKNAHVNINLVLYKNRIYGSDHQLTSTDKNGKYTIDQLSSKSKYLILVENKDKAKLAITDMVAGSKSRKITIPPRKDLKVKFTGDVGILPKQGGKAYIMIKQNIRFESLEPNGASLINTKIFLTPTTDGGIANYQGLFSGKLKLTIGDTSKDVGYVDFKEVDVKENGVTEVTINLPEKKKETLLTLKYDDNGAEGKKSIAGTGNMIEFSLPDKKQKIRGLQLHCARYGYPKAPDEDVEISIVSQDEADLIHTELVPYSHFNRGSTQWRNIYFEDSVDVPEKFWIILNFNAERTKGVFVSYDKSTQGKHSKTGLPGAESQKIEFGGDWMIRALLTSPELN